MFIKTHKLRLTNGGFLFIEHYVNNEWDGIATEYKISNRID